MFLNNAGEHYLRNRVMLAMLNSHKVYHKDTHEEVSLYEALIEEEIKSKDGKVIGKKIVANPDYQVKTTIDG
jgi:hypothetical protein